MSTAPRAITRRGRPALMLLMLALVMMTGVTEGFAMVAADRQPTQEEQKQSGSNSAEAKSVETKLADANTAESGAVEAGTIMTPATATEPVRWPSNLKVPGNLRPLLLRVMERSPTFRRQVEAIAKARNVRMNVTYGGLRGDKLYHALSTVRKHQWGALLVDTRLFVPGDLVELVAHEFEHVCEQIEGVDLRALAARRNQGVLDMGGHFETTRAIAAGQRVTREFQGVAAEGSPLRTTY